MQARPTSLEPVRPVLLCVCLAHLLLALTVVWLVMKTPAEFESPARAVASADRAEERAAGEWWFDPGQFKALTPPAAANAEAPEPSPPPAMEPAASRARYITLSRLNTAAATNSDTPPAAALSASDLSDLDRLDEALYETFMRVWRPPHPRHLNRARRTVRLDVTLNPDVTIAHSELASPSGSAELDLSVLAAAEEVTALLRDRRDDRAALKFPAKLPSPLANSRYDCRILFQVE